MIRIAITTYNRPEMLKALVRRLLYETNDYAFRIHVYDDGSDDLKYVPGAVLYPFSHGGKKGFNRILNAILNDARNDRTWDYMIILPDDVEPVDNFVTRAVRLWNSIGDRRKMALGLLTDDQRRGVANWTGFTPEIKTTNTGEKIYHSQWTEHALICQRPFVQTVPAMMPKDELVWIKNPNRGSGVGAHISMAIHRAGYHIYQAYETLLHHGDHPSLMHPGHRRNEMLTTR